MGKRSAAADLPISYKTRVHYRKKYSVHKHVKMSGRKGKGSRICTKPSVHKPKNPFTGSHRNREVRLEELDGGTQV